MKGRLEMKYRLSPSAYHAVRNSLLPYARLDDISRRAGGRYFVSSLYFDTSDYTAYQEKMYGDQNRVKLRLRSYSSQPDKTPFVSVELKTRCGMRIVKHATRVSVSDYYDFETQGRWLNSENDAVLMEFDRVRRQYAMMPKVLINYHREAFVPRDLGEERITFDHFTEALVSDTLFVPQGTNFRRILAGWVVLEIKTTENPPDWLNRIITMCDLKTVTNSKYATGITHTQNDLVFYSTYR